MFASTTSFYEDTRDYQLRRHVEQRTLLRRSNEGKSIFQRDARSTWRSYSQSCHETGKRIIFYIAAPPHRTQTWKRPLGLFWHLRPSTRTYNSTLYYKPTNCELLLHPNTGLILTQNSRATVYKETTVRRRPEKISQKKKPDGEKTEQEILVRNVSQALNGLSYEALRFKHPHTC